MVCLYVMFCFVIFHGNFPIVEHIHPPGLMQRTQEEVAMNSPLDRLLEVEIIFRPVCCAKRCLCVGILRCYAVFACWFSNIILFMRHKIAARVESSHQTMSADALPVSYVNLLVPNTLLFSTVLHFSRENYIINIFPHSVIGTGLRKITYLNTDTIGNTLTSLCVTDCQVRASFAH